MDEHKRLKVLTPVEGRDKKTHWRSLGIGYVNKDKSINLYLEALPVNGKLQVREWEDERPGYRRNEQVPMPAIGDTRSVPPLNDDMPF